jgi:hypothetical protein
MNSLETGMDSNQQRSNINSASSNENIPGEQIQEFTKNRSSVRQNGFYFEKAHKEGILVKFKHIVVMANVMKQFETKFKKESRLENINITGIGTSGIVFVLDIHEDHLQNSKQDDHSKGKPFFFKSKTPTREDDSSRANNFREKTVQFRPSQGTLVDKSASSRIICI